MVKTIFLAASLLFIVNQKASAQILISAGPDIFVPMTVPENFRLGISLRAELPLSNRLDLYMQGSLHKVRGMYSLGSNYNIFRK